MATPVEGSDFRRRNKEKRVFRLRDLPATHDSAALAREVPNRERGEGKVLQGMMETSQRNFDHMSSELKRFVEMFNEGEADTHYLKERLDPHEHASSAPVFEDLSSTDEDQWYREYSAGAQEILTTAEMPGPGAPRAIPEPGYVRLQPFWPGKNMHVSKLKVEAFNTGELITPGAPGVYDVHDNEYEVHLAIYAGDGPGNMPGTRLEYAGRQAIANGEIVHGVLNNRVRMDINQTLSGGTWYWVGTALSPMPGASGFTPEFFGVTTTQYSLDDFRAFEQTSWWPFHDLDEEVRSQIVSYDYPYSGDYDDPFPEYLDLDDATYAMAGAAIGVRGS